MKDNTDFKKHMTNTISLLKKFSQPDISGIFCEPYFNNLIIPILENYDKLSKEQQKEVISRTFHEEV